jgi:hypothetical protein
MSSENEENGNNEEQEQVTNDQNVNSTSSSSSTKQPDKESVFRGTWQPTLYRPVTNVYQFLPTPLPVEPKKKKQDQPKIEEEIGSPKKKVRDADSPKQRMSGKFNCL